MAESLGRIPRTTDRRERPLKRPIALTPTQATVLELHDQGWTQTRIAAHLGWKGKSKGIGAILATAKDKVGRS